MKKLFPNGKIKEHVSIKRKIQRMANYGLFTVNGTSRPTYTMNSDKVFLRKINFPCDKLDSIVIFAEGMWTAFELK